MNKLLSLALFILACQLPACNFQVAGANRQQTTVSVPTVEVTVVEVLLELYPSPTPVICTSMPSGMTLSVVPVSSTSARLELTGLQPGESVIYIFSAQNDGHTFQMEGHPVTTADTNGRYIEVVNSLSAEMKHWTIQVIHSRGVACIEVDLP